MNNALRMDDYLDTIHLHPKKPVRLDHFQALVEQCRGIDRSLGSHIPRRMFQRLLRRDRVEFCSRRFAERAARRSKDDSANVCWRRDALVARGPKAGRLQALKSGVMLRVDR